MIQGTLPPTDSIASLLLAACRGEMPPVDLDAALASAGKLDVVQDDLDGPGYLVDLGARGGLIVVRGADPNVRRRYTIAHELGHWLLNREANESKHPRHVVERWCDTFAASLLMPKLVLDEYLTCEHPHDLLQRLDAGPQEFEVSREAWWLRVVQLTGIEVFEMRHAGRGAEILARHELGTRNGGASGAREQLLAEVGRRTLPPGLRGPVMVENGAVGAVAGLLKEETGQRTWLVATFPKDYFSRARVI